MKFRFVGVCAPVFAAVFAVVLAPSSVLAEANPNNHGHHYHYGWVHHHSPPPVPAPAPQLGGGPGTTGAHNSIVAVAPVAIAPQAPTVVPPETPVLAPPPDMVVTVQSVLAARNLWLVAILLATLVAVNVTLAVVAVGRGGHFAIKRSLAPLGIRV